MCGIVGYFGPSLGDTRRHVERAAAAILHRGPDDGGFWQDEDAGIAIAHRRLSIIDLSPAGHQPMESQCRRWVLAFNGEIYNHLDLRKQLERTATASDVTASDATAEQARGRQWRGHSDTETLLACCAEWGIEKTLEGVSGMFALALWDRQERTLYLARDRMGEKPLYYGWIGNGFGFASELKALRALPGFTGTIDRAALAAYMGSNQVPGPQSIYVGIRKLMPGQWLALSQARLSEHNLPVSRSYWSLTDVARSKHRSPLVFASDAAATDALESVLSAAVKSQMMADVPLGAFLSGGVDSSVIVALMQSQSGRPVKTFTIGFHEEGFNEAEHAKAVARHLGTEHRELYVDDQAARSVIPLLPELYCEPFADPSQIPTYLVSRMAREHVTVSLSGDAGDELFGGYGRYFLARKLWSVQQRVPAAMRGPVAAVLRGLSPQSWNAVFRGAKPLIPARYRADLPGDRIHKGADFLTFRSFIEMYRLGITRYWSPGVVLGAPTGNIDRALHEPGGGVDGLDDLDQMEQMMLEDGNRYLPDDILAKVDRAAMGVSLETRVPMLDREVVEFAWQLPLNYKVRGEQGKWLLRQVLDRHVPRSLIERPKMGFGVPIDRWLRGPLREWAEDLLDDSRLRQDGYLDPAPIRRCWLEHQSGERNWQYHLWGVLMFQAWLRSQV